MSKRSRSAQQPTATKLNRRYWVSWWQTEESGSFTLNYPWWVSVERIGDGAGSICAAMMARDDDDVRRVVLASHDNPDAPIEWRFIEEKPADWSPFSGRFRQADWMIWEGGRAAVKPSAQWWDCLISCPGHPSGDHTFSIETDRCTRCGINMNLFRIAGQAAKRATNPSPIMEDPAPEPLLPQCCGTCNRWKRIDGHAGICQISPPFWMQYGVDSNATWERDGVGCKAWVVASRFPQPRTNPGGTPCGECHIMPEEVCNICGAVGAPAPGDASDVGR